MSDTELGGATYTPGTGQWSGDDMAAAADQLQPGDVGKLTITFPFPIAGLVQAGAQQLAFLLGPLFAAQGQTLEGIDTDGDSTVVLVFRMGG